MKKILFFSIVCAILSIISCSESSEQNVQQIDTVEGTSISTDKSIEIINDTDQLIEKIDESNLIVQGDAITRSTTSYYFPSPNGGQCGKTSYLFYLKDYGDDPQRTVRLKMPSGNTLYFNLHRWNDYQYINIKSYTCGDIYWSMVNKDNQQPLIGEYKLKNTGVSIAINTTSKLGWPFKSDGSSWQNKNGWYIFDGSDFHINNDIHAQDWNWGNQVNDDLGAKITAPLCGQVVSAGWISNCYGNAVDIIHYSGNKKVMHRVTHLDQINVTRDQWVERGQLIGKLGKSGSSTCPDGNWSAHAHCVLYELNSNNSVVSGLLFDYSY